MKREIKFRGRRIDNGEWVYGDLIHGVGHKFGKAYILPMAVNLAYLPGCHHLDGYDVHPESVGQFTGLHDKNGNEIYEGDVIQLGSIKAKIFWHNGSFHIGLNPNEGANVFNQERASRFEIIGNIYQNPELLTTHAT